jgi:hypothetical protein
MLVTKISKSRGITINTGNFQNVRFDVTMEAEIQSDDLPDQAAAELNQAVADQLWMDIQPVIGTMPAATQRQFARWLDQDWQDESVYPPLPPLSEDEIPF